MSEDILVERYLYLITFWYKDMPLLVRAESMHQARKWAKKAYGEKRADVRQTSKADIDWVNLLGSRVYEA